MVSFSQFCTAARRGFGLDLGFLAYHFHHFCPLSFNVENKLGSEYQEEVPLQERVVRRSFGHCDLEEKEPF